MLICNPLQVIVFKKKRRKGYKRKQGHRDMVTIVRINKILLPAGTPSLTIGAKNVEHAAPQPKRTPEQILAKAASREQSAKALAQNREVAVAAVREIENPVLATAIAAAKAKRDIARGVVQADAAPAALAPLGAYASMPPAVREYYVARRTANMQRQLAQTSTSNIKAAPSAAELQAQKAAAKALREQERASMPAEVKEWVAAQQAAAKAPKAPKTIAKAAKTPRAAVASAMPAEVREWMEAQRAARAQRTAEKTAAGVQESKPVQVKSPEEVEALRAQRRARRAEQAAARPAAVKEYLVRRLGGSVASAAAGKRAFSTFARRYMSTEVGAPATPPTTEATITKLLSSELNATALHIEDTSGQC
jgi:hypothetical protein